MNWLKGTIIERNNQNLIKGGKEVAFNDMRGYMKYLREKGLLLDVDVELNVARETTELQPLMRHLHNQDGPALMLNNLSGYNTKDIPVLFNPYGTRQRTAMILGEDDPLKAKLKHAEILTDQSKWLKPKLIDASKASCKENKIEKKDIDIGKQLPHVWFGKEGPAYITNAVVITKDPETGIPNTGCYRLTQLWNASHPHGEVYSEEEQRTCLSIFAFWNPPGNHIGLHWAKAQEMGKPLEIAIACMVDPVIQIAGATSIPFGLDEMDFAGGLRGEAIEVVDCETVDIQVPANSEWVIEGQFLPKRDVTIGPHSNPIGYYDDAQLFPLIEVDCITHRNDPLWYSTMEMEPPFDHNYMACLPIEGELLSDLQSKIPEVEDVVVTPNLSYFVQLSVDGAQKPHPEFGKFVLHAVWGASGRWGRTAKVVVVVGPDVNPYDLNEVEWAIQTRVQPFSDTIINKSGQAFLMDPSAPKDPGHGIALQSEQIGIDATVKVFERFHTYPEYSNANAEDVAAIAEKLKDIL